MAEGARGSDCIGVAARVEELSGSSRAAVYTENLKAGTYVKSSFPCDLNPKLSRLVDPSSLLSGDSAYSAW
jgi:hypothetical protein